MVINRRCCSNTKLRVKKIASVPTTTYTKLQRVNVAPSISIQSHLWRNNTRASISSSVYFSRECEPMRGYGERYDAERNWRFIIPTACIAAPRSRFWQYRHKWQGTGGAEAYSPDNLATRLTEKITKPTESRLLCKWTFWSDKCRSRDYQPAQTVFSITGYCELMSHSFSPTRTCVYLPNQLCGTHHWLYEFVPVSFRRSCNYFFN